jgi:hypothetical protein
MLKFIKWIKNKASEFINENIIEILIAIGTISISIGMYMVLKPLGYITFGSIVLFLAFTIFKNQ